MKSNKPSNTWIAAGLLTIVTTITTIYCLLEYRNTVWILGLSSLLLLASAYWLFICISRDRKASAAMREKSVGEEQRERMNYEGMKLQGEELIRLVNTIGKGTYVNTKHTSQSLNELSAELIHNQQTITELLQSLQQNQTRTAKFQVKYQQEDTSRLLQALGNMTTSTTAAIANITPAESATTGTIDFSSLDMQGVIDSIQDLSEQLDHINRSIQDLQLQVRTVVEQAEPFSEPNMNMVFPANEEITLETEVAASEVAAVIPDVEETSHEAEIAPPTVEETSHETEIVPPTVEETSHDAEIAPPTVEETSLETEIAPPEVEEVIPESEEIIEDTPAETAGVSSIISDDPNKQLSADEIAALFAALG